MWLWLLGLDDNINYHMHHTTHACTHTHHTPHTCTHTPHTHTPHTHTHHTHTHTPHTHMHTHHTHITDANRKYIEDQEKRDEVDKRIQKGSISDDSFPQPLLKQARAATERVLMPNAPYSAIATRKRKNPPREEKDMAGSSKKLDSSSHNYFFTVSAASKLPPDTDKSHAQNQEFVGTEIQVQSVEAKVPEWKENELVQPWNAGLSKRRCCPGTKGGNHISKDTSTHASRNAAAENLKSLYVRRSGWKQAWSGEWVKDPIAEFDSESDEETEAPSETNGGS